MRKYIISNLILVVIITLIFSGWRVYSTSIWLEELKGYQEKNTKILLEHSIIIEKNQREILDLKQEEQRSLGIAAANQKIIQEIVISFKDYKDKTGKMISEVHSKIIKDFK